MSVLRDLMMNGLVKIEYPTEIYRTVERAINSWRLFCDLPVYFKKEFVYEDEGNLDGAGYELKEGEGKTEDRKENFHVTLKAMPQLTETAAALHDKNALFFMSCAQDLIEAIAPLIFEFTESLERTVASLAGLRQEVEASKHNWFLRYLHYFGDREPGEEIAAPHPDKAGFTLHLYESAPGLLYLDLDADPHDVDTQWFPMPLSEGSTVIIPGMQLQYKLHSLTALYHRVVADESSAKSGRYSMVCFIPLLQTPEWDKQKHGRLQDRPVGFNYWMDAGELNKLFKARS